MGAAKSQGKSTHVFTNFDLFNDVNNTTYFPYSPSSSQAWKRGLPLVEHQWAQESQGTTPGLVKKQTDSLSYDVLPNSVKRAFGIKIGKTYSSELPIDDYALAAILTVDQYPLESDSYQVRTKAATLFASDQAWTTRSAYAYTPDTYQLRRTVSANSDGSLTAQRLAYPTDFQALAANSPLLAGLLTAHRTTVPIEQSQLRLGLKPRLVAGVAHQYAFVTDPDGLRRYYLQTIQAANTETADTTARYTVSALPVYYEEKARTTKVNRRSQPVTQTEQRVRVSAYQWGHDDRYVVASCLNATDTEFFYEGFEETPGAVLGVAHSGLQYQNGPYVVNWVRPNARAYEVSYWARQAGKWRFHKEIYGSNSLALSGGDAYDDIRICPRDASLTTYTFDPLVGMTSQADPAGRTTFYEYDGLGRLLRTRDEQGRILSQQQYHYAGH